MENIEFRKPYNLSQIIYVISKDIEKNGFKNTNFCLYTNEDEEIASSDLICYLDLNPSITDDDEEVYPDFVINESLEFFYDGQQFEDVLMNVLHQKKQASIDDFILGLNYYMEHDTFLDF